MQRRSVILFAFFAVFFVGCIGCSSKEEKAAAPKAIKTPAALIADEKAKTEEAFLKKAAKIHADALTIDTHVDIPEEDYATPKIDPGVDNPELRCDLVKMEKGGMDSVFLVAYTSQEDKFDKAAYRDAYNRALGEFEAIHRVLKMYPNRCELALSPGDVDRISKEGKRAIAICVENGYPIGKDLFKLKKFYDLGARYMTLSHMGHNQICDSSQPDTPKHGGLSEFGKKVVAEMNRLGMMIDTSHIAGSSFFDVLKLSKAPVIASHSGCRALNDHDRNLTDDELRALKQNGGVIQIVALDHFLKKEPKEYTDTMDAARKELGLPSWEEVFKMTKEQREPIQDKLDLFRKRRKEIRKTFAYVSIKDFIDHINHAVNIAGIDHVGIGTDFDGGGGIKGFENHAEAMNVTVELLRRGYSEEDIKKIWGGNLLRVWREVEQVASFLKTESPDSKK